MAIGSHIHRDVARSAGSSAAHIDEVLRAEGRRCMRVFMVEDSAAIRERLGVVINDIDGLEVVGEAATFNDAVNGILRSRPDVAIFDVQLPDGSGIDAMAQVKRQLPALRAIVLTNYPTPQHEKASADAGAEYFLDKSADFEKITEILNSMKADPAGGQR